MLSILRRAWSLLTFVLFYLWELLLSNIRVAIDVMTPRHLMKPGVLAIPLGELDDIELTTLANLLTMTPGTISLDISRDRRTLFIHVMYLDDAAAIKDEIIEVYERKVKEIFRS